MKLTVYDLCISCRKIITSKDTTIEKILNGKVYNNPNPIGIVMWNTIIQQDLEEKGGCLNCINLVKRVNTIQAETGSLIPPPDIIDAIRKKAESGDAEAMMNMALKLFWLESKKNNISYNDEINYWIEKAAINDNAEAQCYLAEIYEDERNDKIKAIEWLEKSAKNGYPKAKCNLACYYNEINDFEKSFYWMEQASNDGHASAKRRLSLIYFNGIGIPVNKEKAYLLMEEAAAMGDEEAIKILKK